MKTVRLISAVILLSVLVGCQREDVSIYAPIESYEDDFHLSEIDNKRAMIIIAHDDDMCAMSGTISKMDKAGWDIRVLSFGATEERNEAQRLACKNILDSVMFFDIHKNSIRNDLESNSLPYRAIPKEEFENIFTYSDVRSDMISKVNAFEPSVILTLDNEIGGYGHPEHVFISQMVLDLAMSDSIKPDYIYQSVFTDHMENSIMGRHSRRMVEWGFAGDGWEHAKKTYDVSGMPEPDVQVNIQAEAEEKMNYLRSYNKRERKTIGFFIPAFEEYSAQEYFEIFNREFFRVIEVHQGQSS